MITPLAVLIPSTLAADDGYRADCIAYATNCREIYWLGGQAQRSPWLALIWLLQRAEHVADQLDPPVARPLRAWLADGYEHAHAVAQLARNEPYTHMICDGRIRYVLAATPVALSADEGEPCGPS